MKNERMQRAKNIASQQYGFGSWDDMFERFGHEQIFMLPYSQIEKVIDRAIVIYSLEFSGIASYDGSNIPAVAFDSFYKAAQNLSLIDVQLLAETAAKLNSVSSIHMQAAAFEKLTSAMKGMKILLKERPRSVVPEKYQSTYKKR